MFESRLIAASGFFAVEVWGIIEREGMKVRLIVKTNNQ